MIIRQLSDEDFFKLKLRQYSKAEVIASALLYMEYRVKYNSKRKGSQVRRCKQCLKGLHEVVKKSPLFGEEFDDLGAFCFYAERAMRENGWFSMECILDGLDLRVGKSGSMPHQTKASLVGVVRSFLEEKWGLPLTKIVRQGDANG